MKEKTTERAILSFATTFGIVVSFLVIVECVIETIILYNFTGVLIICLVALLFFLTKKYIVDPKL